MAKKKFSATGFVLKATLLIAVSICIIMIIKNNGNSEGYIGKSGFTGEDRLTPELMLTLGRVSSPQLSPDGAHILYNVSYSSIEENRSCSNLFICDADGSSEQQLTKEGKSISNAVWSPDGQRIVFLQDGQIWSAPIRERHSGWKLGKKTRLSEIDGGIREFAISPDGSRIMYVKYVNSGLRKPSDLYKDIDKADAICTDDLMYRHWDHWVKEIPHTFISSFDAGKKSCICEESSEDILGPSEALFELPAEPFSGIEQLCWSPDGRFIAYSCKKLSGKAYAFSTDSEIYIFDTQTGNTVTIPMGGGYDTNPVWSPDGRTLCWVSMARNGYEADRQRLMAAETDLAKLAEAMDGGSTSEGGWLHGVREISEGFKYNVSGPVWDGNGTIWFNALAEGVQGIFKASRTTGNEWAIDRITGEELWYDFNSPFGILHEGDSTVLLTSWCSMNFPTELAAVTVRGEETDCRQLTNENTDLLSGLKAPAMEARHIRTTDGKDMLTWVIFPPEFDSSKTYPAIEICLGGPQGTLSQGWSFRWNYRLMAEQGYVVVLPNRRGTTAFGQEWTEQISGDYCGLNMQDYLCAARDIKSEPYIGKIAACGASYGGYSVYNLCGIHGDIFDAFVAHAGIFNQEHMYMTTEEMWFPNWDNGGVPEECSMTQDADGKWATGPAGDGETFGGVRQGGSPWSTRPAAVRHYANSPHKKVTEWHTPILVTHGGMDFRVPADQGMAAYNAAQLMGVPSRLLIFPEENHWILKPQNALLWHREYFSWLDKWCK